MHDYILLRELILSRSPSVRMSAFRYMAPPQTTEWYLPHYWFPFLFDVTPYVSSAEITPTPDENHPESHFGNLNIRIDESWRLQMFTWVKYPMWHLQAMTMFPWKVDPSVIFIRRNVPCLDIQQYSLSPQNDIFATTRFSHFYNVTLSIYTAEITPPLNKLISENLDKPIDESPLMQMFMWDKYHISLKSRPLRNHCSFLFSSWSVRTLRQSECAVFRYTTLHLVT